MQHTEARTILVSLIEGRHPLSGERLPNECFVHHSDVIRALLLGVGAIDATDARAKRRAALPENVGLGWTTKEEEQLRSEFAAKEPLNAIASGHGRTLRAIEARLERMGLITAEERTTRGGFTSPD
ncbi:MAG: hypothetical protein M0038_01455 [Pseudomonadota bacterium]|jgi:hypothetical protein|nr:hypothetical protein [Pseudomonadota bacterium]